jgi:hypothetical protein
MAAFNHKQSGLGALISGGKIWEATYVHDLLEITIPSIKIA